MTGPQDPLAAARRRAAELAAALDAAPDEETACPLADELNAVLDELDNVVELDR